MTDYGLTGDKDPRYFAWITSTWIKKTLGYFGVMINVFVIFRQVPAVAQGMESVSLMKSGKWSSLVSLSSRLFGRYCPPQGL